MGISGLDNDQTATRRPGTLTDQHGRKWSASIDNKTGYPVGVIQPRGWRAPWMPPMASFKFEDRDDPRTFRIDYEGMLDSRSQSHQDYTTQLQQAAIARGWDPTDPEKRSVLEKLVGPPPEPIEVIVAAMQGNSYILGLTDKVDPRVAPFVPRKQTRAQKVLANLPDFRDVPDEELDDLLDLEEAHDPDAIGGKKQKVGRKRAA